METVDNEIQLFEKFAAQHLRLTPEQMRGAQMFHHFQRMMKAHDPSDPERWEKAIRSLYYHLGFDVRSKFEISQVVEKVRELAGESWQE